MAVAARPGRMRLGIDVERELVALLAVGRVGLELGAIRHHHLDHVVIGVEVVLLFHGPLGSLSVARRHCRCARKPAWKHVGPSYCKARRATSAPAGPSPRVAGYI